MPKQPTAERHTAIYVRVSSRQQDAASQLPDLERWAAAQAGPVKWYKDTASGKTMNRPGWRKLENALHTAKVGRVAVWRLDRLGRTVSGLSALFEDLQRRGVGLVSLRDGLDLATPAGRLMANVLAGVAQYETEVRGDRVAAGQAVARAAGKRWGGSAPGRLIHVTPEQVATIERMRDEGAGKASMARATGLSRPTVYRLLQQHCGAQTAAA